MIELNIGDKVNVTSGRYAGRTAKFHRHCSAMKDWCYIILDKRARERVEKKVIIEKKNLAIADENITN